MSKQIKVYAGKDTAAKWDTVRDFFTSNTSAFAVMVEQTYNSLPFTVNEMFTELGITGQREAFSKWRHENNVPDRATIPEWKNYLLEFETDGDAADEYDTQRCAQ